MIKYTCLIPHGRTTLVPTLTSIVNQTILPKKICIVDNKDVSTPPDSYFYNICRYKGIQLVYESSSAQSIARVRYELSNRNETDYCLWVDDDVILNSTYVEQLSHFISENVGMIQGTRIECNGRENSPLDINKMNSFNIQESMDLDYGDTFGLLCSRLALEKINWKKILEILDAPGVTGEDVIMGNMVRDSGLKILGISDVFGWHIAPKTFSYWNTLLASDRLRELHFSQNTTGVNE